MTRKLYYEDCHLTRFQAKVTGCEPCDKGYEITLDATAFYPEGGGQACDLGTLGSARVLDVRERGKRYVICVFLFVRTETHPVYLLRRENHVQEHLQTLHLGRPGYSADN